MEKELERGSQSVTHTCHESREWSRSHRRQVEKELEERQQSVTHTCHESREWLVAQSQEAGGEGT